MRTYLLVECNRVTWLSQRSTDSGEKAFQRHGTVKTLGVLPTPAIQNRDCRGPRLRLALSRSAPAPGAQDDTLMNSFDCRPKTACSTHADTTTLKSLATELLSSLLILLLCQLAAGFAFA